MGAGIAVLFKKKFGGVQELLDQSEWCLKELLVSSREGVGAVWGYEVWMLLEHFGFCALEKKTGEVAVLQRDDRYIYYLVRAGVALGHLPGAKLSH